jgi:Cu-processing system permease protein
VLLVAVGFLLSVVFIGIGFWVAMSFKDRVAGLAFALFLWLFLAVGYDGLVLMGTRLFADYPLEVPLLGAMMLNPVDLARVSLLTLSDLSAMMGYTGALFLRFFGSSYGLAIIATVLFAWIVIPAVATGRRFVIRDF